MSQTSCIICLGILSSVLLGCSTRAPETDLKVQKSLNLLERKLRRSQQQVSDLREKYMVLEELMASQKRSVKKATATVVSPPLASQKVISSPATSARKVEQKLKVPETSFKNEHYMYAKVVGSFRQRDEETLAKAVQLFLRSFPGSVHADNALYLLGRFYFENGQLKKAWSSFERLQREYPFSNKYPASQLARGVILKRLRRTKEARVELTRVLKLFPGSREAFLSKTELKLLKAGS